MAENHVNTIGAQSIHLKTGVFICASASVVGKKEGEGPYGKYFDEIIGG